MELLIDANRYVDMIRGDADVSARLNQATRVYLPLIVLGELLAGFATGMNRTSNEAKLRRFLNKPQTVLLLPNEQTAVFYAQVHQSLRQIGKPIPSNDMWIAAQAVQHDLPLDTRDGHFKHVPGLKLV
jgi:tRNA(fMet)-specific endonuclease VapC